LLDKPKDSNQQQQEQQQQQQDDKQNSTQEHRPHYKTSQKVMDYCKHNNIPVMFTSAKDGYNVKETFHEAVRVLRRNERVCYGPPPDRNRKKDCTVQ